MADLERRRVVPVRCRLGGRDEVADGRGVQQAGGHVWNGASVERSSGTATLRPATHSGLHGRTVTDASQDATGLLAVIVTNYSPEPNVLTKGRTAIVCGPSHSSEDSTSTPLHPNVTFSSGTGLPALVVGPALDQVLFRQVERDAVELRVLLQHDGFHGRGGRKRLECPVLSRRFEVAHVRNKVLPA